MDDWSMHWSLSCAWVLAVWSAIYLVDVYARRTKLDAYLRFVEYTGIVVHPLQVRWYTGGVESLLHRWAMLDRPIVRRICHAWFTIGAVVATAAMVFMLGFLSHNVWTSIAPFIYAPPPSMSASTAHPSLKSASTSSSRPRSGSALVPVIPGVNVPWSHMPLFAASLVLAGVVHELGHAIAACAEKVNVNGFGVFVLLVYPGAFTEIDTATLQAASRIQRLRVYTAGIWHNVILALLAIGCLHVLPLAMSPLYMHNKGVMVTDVVPGSSLGGPRGLAADNVVYAINQCKVYNAQSWAACLRQMQTSVYGYCLPHAKVDDREHTVQMERVDDEISCCDGNSTTSHMCFYYANNTRGTDAQNATLLTRHMVSKNENTTEYTCLSGRTATDHYMCNVTTPCTARTTCVYPALYNSSALLRFAIANSSRPVLYVAYVPDVFADISVTSYVPRWRGILSPPVWLPPLLELFLKYTITFSFALAMLNAVPCFTLDGQFMSQWLFTDVLCRSSKGGGFTRRSGDKGRLWSNVLLYYGTAVLLVNVVIALVGVVR